MAAYPNVNAAQQYARDVVAGKILACQHVINACQRHLDDVKRSKAAAYPYRFDRDAAERVCKFIQLLPHTKGEWARAQGVKARIKLEPWQLFIYAVSFGWVRKRDKKRRFREVYVEVPRKNGKSILAAGTGLYLFCADNEYGAEVYCGASTEKQAWEVFKPAMQMAKKVPALRKHFNLDVWAKKMIRPDGSVFEPVIGDPGDGSSPHGGIVDEYHEHDDANLYDTLSTGMGARTQPLMWVITTAGYNLDGPCYDMRDRVVEMLEGVTQDDELFGIIHTIDTGDDWTTEEALVKANPNAGVSVSLEYLKAQQQKAINRARFTNRFKTKHLGVWVTAKEGFFNMEAWKACEDETLTLDQFAGENCILAFDLARKLDMNSMARLFWREIDGKRHYYSVGPRFWVPEDTAFDNDDRRTAERFQGWINAGYLDATEGSEVDYREILEAAKEANAETPALESPIDPHGAANLSHQLADEGLSPISITQNFTNMSDPMKELEAAIISGRFHHDGNPIMTWCVGNVIGKHLAGNDDIVRPIKQGAHNKIDGAVAEIMAVGRAMANDREPVEDLDDFINNMVIV